MKKLEYRMYGLVPFNISEIQKGIQYGHAVVEYALKYFKDQDFQHWAKNDKTFIILNGGTTNEGSLWNMQGIQNHNNLLNENKIKHACFYEPDLNNTLTAIVFLADERVFDKKKYPDLVNPSFEKEWVKSIGGKQNAFLREFLSNFRLA